jgi:hypothetical protein
MEIGSVVVCREELVADKTIHVFIAIRKNEKRCCPFLKRIYRPSN